MECVIRGLNKQFQGSTGRWAGQLTSVGRWAAGLQWIFEVDFEANFRQFPFSMTRKCKVGEEEKTHRAQELGDGFHGRLDVGGIGMGVGSGNGLLGGCWAVVYCKKTCGFFGFMCHFNS